MGTARSQLLRDLIATIPGRRETNSSLMQPVFA
jgi:hypothetical protein